MLNPATDPLISIVCPMHNEGPGITVFYEALCALFDNMPHMRFELICIDDGSTDHTLPTLIELTTKDQRIKVIELSRNFGKEAALTAGIEACIGDAVIPIDADLQNPPNLVPQMIALWQQGYDVVLAKRSNRSKEVFFRKLTAHLFYRLHNAISSVRIPENVGDFRLMDRRVVMALKTLPEQQRFMKGLFAWVGFKTVTIDYVCQERVHGQSKFSKWKLWNFALEGITSFSAEPLKVWTYVGAVGALLAFTYGTFIVLRTLMYGVDVPGYASLLVAVLFLGSLQLISVGMLGEYIGRIYLETKRRPPYVIRECYPTRKTD
jgi:glycosyltransferase involved in cell wall biosynthesis